MFPRSTAPSAVTLGLLLLGAAPLRAQDADPDPCASTVTRGELKMCWARELEHAESDMKRAFGELRASFPRDRADALDRAQKLWVEFRDIHVRALYGADWRDPDHFTCALIAMRQLTVARTAQLERMRRDSGDEASCPL
jgi:uncharacterized protein YecT (DUF1311 family)